MSIQFTARSKELCRITQQEISTKFFANPAIGFQNVCQNLPEKVLEAQIVLCALVVLKGRKELSSQPMKDDWKPIFEEEIGKNWSSGQNKVKFGQNHEVKFSDDSKLLTENEKKLLFEIKNRKNNQNRYLRPNSKLNGNVCLALTTKNGNQPWLMQCDLSFMFKK